MHKLSGLVLDVYDDPRGSVMREIFPSPETIPEVIKEAHLIVSEERASLPDDVFALVLQDEGATLRKYACIDEGNTRVNVEYFLKVAHKLPVDAAMVAADNLVVACGWYGIDPPAPLLGIAGRG